MQISKTFVNFPQAFATSSEQISEFFSQAGLGYYIPLYQREYSWDTENIDQLMDDLCQGVDMLIEKDDSILFMGTIILLTESNPNQNIKPKDVRAIPTRVDNVIDGQQRISTFALLASLLHARLREVSSDLRKTADKVTLDADMAQEIGQVEQEITSQLATLIEVFSVDLKRGEPTKKPIIIRGSVDCWTLDGPDDNYVSDVARHLATAIRAIEDKKAFPWPKETSPVRRNLRRMNEHLDKVVEAHKGISDEYPPAWNILQGIPEEAIWSYQKQKLADVIRACSAPLSPLEERLCAVVQLLAFTNFLLKRCCFTVIRPTAESWAFDMFQSLNATGTPLTAIETFKPMVSNYAAMHGGYKGSQSEKYFAGVDRYLGQAKTANQKNRLTNDYLTTFALILDGRRLPSQFSAQRRFLEEQYERGSTPTEREEFMRRMSDLAEYRRLVAEVPIDAQTRIPGTEGAPDAERELATLCVAYLKKANHKMADTILSLFYAKLLQADASAVPAARTEFIGVCKALAAFYTLWRSAYSNSGLDDVYRKMLRGEDKDGKDGLSYKGDAANLTLANLKSALRDALADPKRDIATKAKWKSRASNELRYGNGVDQICRFASLVAAHDTVPDPAAPALMVKGQRGVQPYLRLEQWLSEDLSSIEHIAPQNASARVPWDLNLYDDECYQRIGNLTLLPLEINISASNKGWKEKCLYYKHLVIQDPVADRATIAKEVQSYNISLNPETAKRLEDAKHIAHIRPIVQVDMTGNWDRALVEARSERICELLWDEIYPWLM
jgi:hypothetical protein